jgi:uncharacterized sporulation protein YeaH/YhbH (DUF444 family)
MPDGGMPMILRARTLAGRAVRRAARPALHGPGSPVRDLAERVDGIEHSLAELWRISEQMRTAIDELRDSIERSMPDVVEDIDRRFALYDESRAEEVQALEAVRRRVQALEAADGDANR